LERVGHYSIITNTLLPNHQATKELKKCVKEAVKKKRLLMYEQLASQVMKINLNQVIK
jgi:hypothetical protein